MCSKILLIGPMGAGKSTLGNKLSEKLHIPGYHLDTLFYAVAHKNKTVLVDILHNIFIQDSYIRGISK